MSLHNRPQSSQPSQLGANAYARRLEPLSFPGQILLGVAEQRTGPGPSTRPSSRRPTFPTASPIPGPARTALPRTAPPARAAAPAHAGLQAPHLLESLRGVVERLSGLARNSRHLRLLQGRDRRLQVQDTVQLGEKRFAAVLRVDGERFLIGGGTGGISLLAKLAGETALPTLATVQIDPVQIESLQIEPLPILTANDSPFASPIAAATEPSSFSAVFAAHAHPAGQA